ncbi:MAG: Tfp pilus assembly pilus retraction ATPase PilT [Planctomycetota bacterium]|jgi:Tfp pilus assembly pilus retraction ATPase PilT
MTTVPADQGVDGDLKNFSIFDITHTLMMSRKTALVTIEKKSRKGFLYFHAGQIISAIDDNLNTGEKAAFKIFFMRGGRFKMEFDVAPRERNIKLDTENLLLEIARNLDENRRDNLMGDVDESDASQTVEEQFQDKFRNELTKVFDKVASDSSPVRAKYTVNAFDPLLVALNDLGGTALFLRPGAKPRIKSKTGFTTIKQDIVTPDEIKGFLQTLLSPTEANELAENHEVSVYYSADGAGSFQVRGFHDSGRPAIIFSPASKSIPALTRLIPNAAEVSSLLDATGGLYLLIGPLASGKTTILASLLEDGLRNRDFLITSFGRTHTYEYTQEAGFLIRDDINRFSLAYDGGLQSAIDQGSDVIAVDEICDASMFVDACVVASRAGLVLATCEADNLQDFSERMKSFTLEDSTGKLKNRLGQCLKGILMIDLSSEDHVKPKLQIIKLDEQDRARFAEGDFSLANTSPVLT